MCKNVAWKGLNMIRNNVCKHIRSRANKVHLTSGMIYGCLWTTWFLYDVADGRVFFTDQQHIFIMCGLRMLIPIALSYLFAKREIDNFMKEAFISQGISGQRVDDEVFEEIGKTGIFLSPNNILFRQGSAYHLIFREEINEIQEIGQRTENMKMKKNALALSVSEARREVAIIYTNDPTVNPVEEIDTWVFKSHDMRGNECPHCGQNNPVLATKCDWCHEKLFDPYTSTNESLGFVEFNIHDKLNEYLQSMQKDFAPKKMSLGMKLVYLGLVLLVIGLWRMHIQSTLPFVEEAKTAMIVLGMYL